jgi:PPE-repeat protein
MDNRLILCAAIAAIGGAGLSQMLSRPVIAQPFGQAGNSNGVSATAPNAAGVSHAWTVDLRTNTVVMCRGDSSGKVACTQALMPGAANIQR